MPQQEPLISFSVVTGAGAATVVTTPARSQGYCILLFSRVPKVFGVILVGYFLLLMSLYFMVCVL